MVRGSILWSLGCCAAVAPGAAWAQPDDATTAQVSGWAAGASAVPVYSRDGSPRGKENLSGISVVGVRPWIPEYDLIKLTSDPSDDRWIPTKYFNLVFCRAPAPPPPMPVAGRPRENGAMGYNSGGKCRQ